MTAIDRLDAWLRISPSTVLPAEVLEYLDDVKAENEKLREELAKWERLAAGIDLPEYPVTQFKPKDLERENAKLRELASILYFCMQIHKQCDDCKLNGAKCEIVHDPLLVCDELHGMLRELGIEVDE